MKIKLLLISSVILAAFGLAFLSSSVANAAPICGDTDFIGPCITAGKVCDDSGFIGPCAATDYTKVDCATAYNASHSYEGPSRCNAIKKCISGGGQAASCLTQWVTCRDKVAVANGAMKSTDRENCINTVGGALTIPEPPDDKKSSCTIDGIGWIVCPVMHFMAKVVDQSYGIVSSLLTTPAVSTDTNSDMFKAWSIMRNFANVAFVIAFLLIIYSQITSVGISNYGIKKMLPRLIIAAILVNISYWICAIAVDISNILGSSFKGLLEGASKQLYTSGTVGQSGAGGNWDKLTVTLLAGGAAAAALYAGLSALLPLLIMALLAIVTVLLVLTLRQALIIILIVVSPLAFVAYLLPNTEPVYKKWKDLGQTLLLMFPIISIIFGGCALASTIITNTAGGSFILATMAAGVTIVPLFITPIVMKTAGGVLGRFGAIVNNPNKGPFDRAKKGAEGYRTNRQEYRKLKALNGVRTLPGRGITSRRGAQREAVLSNRKTELNRANASYVAGLAEQNSGFRGKLAQGGGEGSDMRALAGAINIQAELQTKEVKAASAVIEHMNLSSSDLNKLAMGGEATDPNNSERTLSGGDDAVRKAAIQQAVAKGTVKDVEQIITGSDADGIQLVPNAQPRSASQNKILSDAVASSNIANKATHLAGQTIDDISQGKVTSNADLDNVMARAIEGGKYSAENLADNDKDSLKRLNTLLDNPPANLAANHADKINNVKAAAAKALDDNRISGRIKDAQRPFLQNMRTPSGTPPNP